MKDPETMEKRAIQSMVKFRRDANLYRFWRNVYKAAKKAREEQEQMSAVWLNGRKPPYMESDERDSLTPDKIKHAVNSMTYEGLKLCAIGYLLCMQKMEQTPAQISGDLEAVARVGQRPLFANEDDGKPAA